MTLAQSLLRWYQKHGRDLPWRKTKNPYHIVVSELMLQQTQVSRGLIFYPRWLAHFPDWNTLATATNADVITAWAGLGYNRRALMLRDMARIIVAHGVPKTSSDWIELKGIGPYTAAAIACFSFGEKALPIDTNIRRVLGRVFLKKAFPEISDDNNIRLASNQLLSTKQFHDVPQALFDLATTVCTKTPQCQICPLKDLCPSSKGFIEGRYITPKRTIKKANEIHHRNKKYPDRIYRGRILKMVREEKRIKPSSVFGKMIDPSFNTKEDLTWLNRMIERLIKDGLIEAKNGWLQLPR